jgi:hypothetical protein
MFESDQHDFDEEYEGYRHPAPPSPPAPTAPTPTPAVTAAAEARPTPAAATATAVEEPLVEQPHVEAPQPAAEDEAEDHDSEGEPESEEFVDPAEGQERPPARKKPNLLMFAAFGGLILVAVIAFTLARPKQNTPPPGDMGPGIVAASGLRGHLNTQWEGNEKTGKLAYQLQIEPMEDRWQAGFSRVTLDAPKPLSVNVRLLDASGFALCGKEIDFRFDPRGAGVPIAVPFENGKKSPAAERVAAWSAARESEITRMQADEAAREHGKDIFQNQVTNDGQVSAVNVQGTLPCSPDQYRRASYWDFNTNFPTLDEQAALVDPRAAMLAKGEFTPPGSLKRRTLSRLPQEGFVIQGDERVTGYDSARGVLWAEGKSFQIDKRYGQVTASAWANDYSLIHYRCDQHANCALTAAGNAAVLHARLEE